MRLFKRIAASILVVTAALAWMTPGLANGDRNDGRFLRARLSGLSEVPVISTSASGTLRLSFDRWNDSIDYELTYRNLESAVTQAHIHIAQDDVNGGVAVFLCSNLAAPPAGTPACPSPSGTVSGRITADQVIGPTGQGVSPGEFEEFRRMLRNGNTYANVHSTTFTGGEIRGQIH